MKHSVALAAWISVVGTPLIAMGQDKPSAKSSDVFELVYFRDAGPIVVRFDVAVGAEPAGQRFDAYLKKWFDFADGNGDGLLSDSELKSAPRSPTLLQIVRSGSIFIAPQGPLTMAELGKDKRDAITLAEFQQYYRKNGVQPFQVPANFGQALGNPFYDQVSDALLKAIDRNKDGKLSREELSDSPRSLRKFDLDDDELITTQELAPGGNPVAMGRPFVLGGGAAAGDNREGASFYYLHYPNARARLGILLLARYDKDKNTRLSSAEADFDPEVFKRLDKDNDGGLDVEELHGWASAADDVTFAVKLSKPRETTIELKHAAPRLAKAATKTADGAFQMHLGEALVHVQENQGTAATFRFDQRQAIMQQFKFLDKDNLGFIKLTDPANPMVRTPLSGFAGADRNGDGKLTLEELMDYADLAQQATQQQVSFAGQEQGRTFFQMLDLNRDGRLSARELLGAWERLKGIDRDGDECISAVEIPKQHQIVFALGAVQSFSLPVSFQGVRPGGGPDTRNAPLWFRKMDTNSDGEVSLLEFLGPRSEFDRIDANRDGLLTVDEAARYDAQARQKKG